jgi:hypothetical protein
MIHTEFTSYHSSSTVESHDSRTPTFITKLKSILLDKTETEMTVKELLDYFGDDSIKVLMCLITFITSIPLPPWGGGFETVPGGVLCILLSLQGLVGMTQLYLPKFIRDYRIPLRIVQESSYTKKTFDVLETWLTPNRYAKVFHPITEKMLYLLIIANAILMMIPIIFTNALPSQSITVLTLAWLLSDGVVFSICFLLSILILIAYAFFFFWFSKFLYKTRRTWTFGLWK